MRVSKLDINNFRGFEKAQIDFGQSNVSVFIGTNGQGKSSVLDLIAYHLQQFTNRIAKLSTATRSNLSKLVENDIHIGTDATFNTITVELHPFIIPSSEEKQTLTWSASKEIDEPSFNFREANSINFKLFQKWLSEQRLQEKELFELAEDIHGKVRRDEDVNIPILVYYQSNRTVFGEVALREKHNNYLIKQFAAYDNAFVKKSNDFDDFGSWYRNEEDKENEMKIREKDFNFRNPALQIVRDSITIFFSNNSGSKYSNLRVVRKESQFQDGLRRSSGLSSASLVISKDNEDLRIEQLSDGEKNLILLVSDIARRLAIANQNKTTALEGEGIVLIDEVELHLHPTWQREVLNGLQKTFPNVQFIVTTHSPLILANLNEDVQIFSIQRPKNKSIVVVPIDKKKFNPYGSASSRVLRLLMGTSERPTEVSNLLKAYENAIDDNRLEEAERLETQLKALIDPKDPDIIQGAATIEAKRILQEI